MFFSRNTFLILAQRGWQSFAGLITLAIVSTVLTPEQQGWYYAFVSVAALYSVFEMGLASAILQVAAHMSSGLSWGRQGRIQGDRASEFEALTYGSFSVYCKLASLFMFIAMPIGAYLFTTKNTAQLGHPWALPWIMVLLATTLNMISLPFLAIVEGSGKIREVYTVRLVQGVAGAATCWIALLSGGFLWAAAMTPLAGVLVVIFWLKQWRPDFLSVALRANHLKRFDWRSQVWELQWRVGVSWVSVFLMSQLATPILFFFQDAVVAGQMGLTLTIAHMLGIFSQSWIARDVPAMTVLVSERDWKGLDRIFFADFKHMTLVFLLGSILLMFIYGMLSNTPYVNRILPFWQIIGLLAFVLLFQATGALAAYLRSFKMEPLMLIYFFGAILIVIGSLFAASRYSSSGVILVMLAVQGVWVFPASLWVWKTCRQTWTRVAIETTA